MAGCAFCEIASGASTASIVMAGEAAIAFLDHAPLFPGHTLVTPRPHVVTLEELPEPSIGGFFGAVRSVARAVRLGTNAQGTLVLMNNVVSQSVPHLHAHVVPRNRGDGLRGFLWPRQRYPDPESREATRAAIAAHL